MSFRELLPTVFTMQLKTLREQISRAKELILAEHLVDPPPYWES